MKTKMFKTVLPAFAIILAVGLSFATEATSSTSQIAYYNHPVLGLQSTMVGDECDADGKIACEFNGYQLYAEPSLSTELRKD